MLGVRSIRGKTKGALVLLSVGFAAGYLANISLAAESQAQTRATTNTQLLRVDIGDWCRGKQVSIEIQEAGPGASGNHYHPGYSFAWIVSGSLVRTIQGQVPRVSNAGDVVYEAPMEISETRNTVPVKSVIFRVVETGKPNTVTVP